jgi:hypothetical protein
MDRLALLVGIDEYNNAPPLASCVADAEAMEKALAYHKGRDQPKNYHCTKLCGRKGSPVRRADLRAACNKLFESRQHEDSVLLYFSGHGCLAHTGGILCTSDAERYDPGVSMEEIVLMAVKCPAHNVLLLLDCCHSGDFANPGILNTGVGAYPLAAVREGMTVIAASMDSEVAVEAGGLGLFTAAVLDALEGGAADHMGWVTAPSIYAYVRRRFAGVSQRPIYKAHSTDVPVVRECEPLIDRLKLRELVTYFPSEHYKFRLDPEYEPEDEHGNVKEPSNMDKVRIAQLFKEFRDAGLLKPSNPAEQLFWTARRSGTVELTRRGHEYWWLVSNKLI